MPSPALDDAVAAATPADRRRAGWALSLAVFALALIVRLVSVWQMHRANPLFYHPILDAELHDRWARAILSGERLFEGAYFRAPLYPWLLSVIYRLFGPDLLIARVVQAAVGSLTCSFLYLLGRDAFGRTAGLLAGLLAACYWPLVYFDGELLVEPLGNLLNVAGVWFLLRGERRHSPWLCVMAGLLLGLSALNRPNVLALMPLFAGWLVWSLRPRLGRGFAFGLVFLAGCALPILPVTLRNYVVGHDRVLIAWQGGPNFWIGNNPEANGTSAVMPGARRDWWGGYEDWIALAEQEAGRPLKGSEVSSHYFSKAVAFMRAQPVAALDLLFRKFQYFWHPIELANNDNPHFFTHHFAPIYRFLPVGFDLVAPLALWGMWQSRRSNLSQFPLWGFVLVYSLGVMAFFVASRMRLPIVPFLIVYAAACVVEFGRALRAAQWPAVGRSAVGVAILWLLVNRSGVPAGYADDAHARCQVANAWLAQKDYEKAGREFAAALETDPKLAFAAAGLGDVALERSRYAEAVEHYERSRTIDPTWIVHDRLGFAYERLGRWDDALRTYRAGIGIAPGFVEIRRRWAFLLATCPAGEYRNGLEAVKLAEEVVRRSTPTALLYDTLAAAYAEAGRYPEAVGAIEKALSLAERNQDFAAMTALSERRELYRAGRPFHQGRLH